MFFSQNLRDNLIIVLMFFNNYKKKNFYITFISGSKKDY